MANLVIFQDAEGLIDTALTADIFRIENVAHILRVEPVKVADDSIKLCLQDSAARRIEDPWLLGFELRQLLLLFIVQLFVEFFCPAVKVVIEVSEFGNATCNLPLEVRGDGIER